MTEPLYIYLHIPKCGGTTINKTCSINAPFPRALHLVPEKLIDYLAGADGIGSKRAKALRGTVNFKWDECHELHNAFLASLDEQSKARVRILYGHGTYFGIHEHFPGRSPFYFTFLRDPVQRVISHFNYLHTQGRLRQEVFGLIDESGRERGIREWLNASNYGANLMTRYLAGMARCHHDNEARVSRDDLHQAISALDKCSFIGFTGKREDFELMFDRLGFRRGIGRQNRTRVKRVGKITPELHALLSQHNRLDDELMDHARSLLKHRCGSDQGPNHVLRFMRRLSKNRRSFKRRFGF